MKRDQIAMAVFLLIISGFFSGLILGKRISTNGTNGDCDTVTVYKTVYRDSPISKTESTIGTIHVPLYLILPDDTRDTVVRTIVVKDTEYVCLPRVERYYEELDGRLRIWMSGYDPSLDRYELDEKQTTIVPKRDRWNLSLSGGIGVTAYGITPTLGVTVGYTIFSW